MKKVIAIIATGAIFLAAAYLLLAEDSAAHPLLAALYGAAGTAALLYWPRKGCLQLLSLCWLCILLYGMALLELATCTTVYSTVVYTPSSAEILILMSIPFLLVMLPICTYYMRAYYYEHMRGELEDAVLAATDPLDGPTEGALEKARKLLTKGIPADDIPDALVARDELVFEAIGTPNAQAVANTLELLPLLAKAGATISRDSLKSAKYNCPLSIQAELEKLPVTPDNRL